ncbi:hypothetical protein Tco_0387520 [Tanacetum coccineum]
MHNMKEDYCSDKVTLYPTQIFSVNNWTLKPNQLEEPPFTAYMLAICALDKPVVFKAPNDSIPPQQDQTKSVSKGLETVLTQPTIEKGASSIAIHGDKEEASSTIKLEDLTKLVS